MIAKKAVYHFLSLLLLVGFMQASGPYQAVHAAGVRCARPAAIGLGDCSSWENACTLQTALTGSASGDEIWVAAGVHKPSTGSNIATFQLKDGVAIYGECHVSAIPFEWLRLAQSKIRVVSIVIGVLIETGNRTTTAEAVGDKCHSIRDIVVDSKEICPRR